MNIDSLIKSGANVSVTVSLFDLREWAQELICNQPPVTPEPPERHLTPLQAAKKLGVNVSTLWRWDKSGYLKKIKVGNSVRYRESDVNKIMEG